MTEQTQPVFERLDDTSYRVHSYPDLVEAATQWNGGVKPFFYYSPNGMLRRYPCVVSFSKHDVDGVRVDGPTVRACTGEDGKTSFVDNEPSNEHQTNSRTSAP